MFIQNNITKEDKKKTYPLTSLDLEMILLFVSSPLMALLLRICFYTGTDIKYLLEMTYGDITSVSRGKLKIRLLYNSIPDIPVDDGIAEILKPYAGKKPEREFFFTHEDGSTWSTAYVDNQIAAIAEQSGIFFTADSLRNSYFNTIVNNIVKPGKKKAKDKLLKEMIAELAA